MRGASLGKFGGIAPGTELFTEIVAAIRLAGLGRYECQMLAWRRVYYRSQLGMHRDI